MYLSGASDVIFHQAMDIDEEEMIKVPCRQYICRYAIGIVNLQAQARRLSKLCAYTYRIGCPLGMKGHDAEGKNGNRQGYFLN